MADSSIIKYALDKGYTLDQIADTLTQDAGYDPIAVRDKGYKTNDMLSRLGYEIAQPKQASGFSGVSDAFTTGISNVKRAGSATYDVLTGNLSGVEKTAADQNTAVKPQELTWIKSCTYFLSCRLG